jgi:nicotinamide-nucleotide amidase
LKTEIISIGTELLLGDIIDSNSKYLAEKLNALGYDINYITTVGDNKNRLIEIFEKALKRSELIISTGGLGPTDDDLTREVISEVNCRPLKIDYFLEEKIRDFFYKKNYIMPKNNIKQAYLPDGAKAIPNHWGTAAGILLETANNIIISMPGVPREMKKIFDIEVIPYLKEKNNMIIKSRVLKLFGIGESRLEELIKDILDRQINPTIALLAGNGEVKIRITAKGDNIYEKEEKIKIVEDKIRKIVNEYIYGVDQDSLPLVTGSLLKEKGLSIAIAESCTGGLIGKRITDIPGSSVYFRGGLITYSNESKINILGVNDHTLKDYGAVSNEVACEMADGARKLLNSNIGLSVTGIAGPGGANKNKAIGLVYIGFSDGNIITSYRLNFRGDRSLNRWMSSQYVFYYLLKYLRDVEAGK